MTILYIYIYYNFTTHKEVMNDWINELAVH